MELRIEAVKGFGGSFSLETDLVVSGDTVGVFGASGSGKSTLVALISGLAAPELGEIYLDGDCLYSSRRGINLPPHRRRVAVVFQDSCLFPHLSVEANLRYGQKGSPKGGGERSTSRLWSRC